MKTHVAELLHHMKGWGNLGLQHKEEPTKLLTLQHKPLQQVSVPGIMQDGKIFVLPRQCRMGNLVCLISEPSERREMFFPTICLNFPRSPR